VFSVSPLSPNTTYILYFLASNAGGDSLVQSVNFTTGSLSSDASLASVAGQTITTTGGAGAYNNPYTAKITVLNSKASITLSDILTTDSNASVNAIYDANPTTGASGVVSVSLTAGGATHVYIYTRAENGTACFYDITVTRAEEDTTTNPPGGTTTNPPGGTITNPPGGSENPADSTGGSGAGTGSGAAVTTTRTTGGTTSTPAGPVDLTNTNDTGSTTGTGSANSTTGTGNNGTQSNGGQINEGETPLGATDNAGSSLWWLWLAFATIILVAIIWVFIAMKRRKEEEDEAAI
jgi:hypothetical protein